MMPLRVVWLQLRNRGRNLISYPLPPQLQRQLICLGTSRVNSTAGTKSMSRVISTIYEGEQKEQKKLNGISDKQDKQKHFLSV